jgi:AcrR family transcriptional regulator
VRTWADNVMYTLLCAYGSGRAADRTGMDQLCAAAQVSKRTAYQHFTRKDELVAEYLRRLDPSVLSGVFDRTDLTPRERLLAVFDIPSTTPLCPYITAAIELHDPEHPASQYARDYKKAVAARLGDTAREAGAADPEQLGGQLALLIDGAAVRTRVLNSDAFPAAAAIAAVLIDNAIPPQPAMTGDGRKSHVNVAPTVVMSRSVPLTTS